MMRSRLLSALILLTAAACGRPDAPDADAPAVAHVDGVPLLARDFQLSYAFGHGHLRAGDDPRRAYLTYMIYEHLLAREAERLRLDTTAAVASALHTLREELLVEEVFEAHVLSKIEVTDEEIRQEVNRAAVQFRFRFVPAATEREARARYEQAVAEGFDRASAEARAAFAELGVDTSEWTSPLVRAEEVDPDVLAVIQDLPLHTPSEPVARGGQWYVFEVTELRRERLADVDYARQAPTYRKVVYNRKAMEQGAAFVAATMEPRQVVTRREGFEILHAALWAWYREETPTGNLLDAMTRGGLDTRYTQMLARHFDDPLVQFDGQTWTLHTFLRHFTPGRYVLRARDPQSFRARLADVVALVVRDHVFLRMAEAEHLDDTPTFRHDLAQWRDKWLFEAFRRHLDARLSEADVRASYAAADARRPEALVPYDRLGAEARARLRQRLVQERLRRHADSLYARHDVEIDAAVLDTLTLDAPADDPTATVYLFKSNANKMPFPIPDAAWRPGGERTP